LVFIVSGPGGVGKGTVVARLLKLDPTLRLSRSWTTRPRRPREPADAYVFVDRPTFLDNLERGAFLEWNELPSNGHLYGTPSLDLDEPGDVLLEIELNGAQQVKARYPDAVLIFIVPPSVEALEARLRGRGDADDSVKRRLALGRQELEAGPLIADHLVVNDDVDRAAREVAGIISQRRKTPGSQFCQE
jgi:guanylate kinase